MKRVKELIINAKDRQYLDLSDNQLSDLPKEIAELKNLKKLYLNDNQLSDLPKEIAELKSLQTLDLRNNQLSDLPKEIAELKSLQELYLSSNQLSDLSKEIAELKNLKKLYLNDNQLSDLPKEIAELKSLQTLNLSSNQLSDLPKEIAELKSLQTLNLSYNKLSDLPKEIAELKNLQTLYLKKTQLSDLPKEIAELKSLQYLDLSYNQLSDLPKVIAELKSLQTLNLKKTQLSDLPKEIAELKSLQTLDLRDNQFSDLPKEITELKSLQTLYLSETQLSDLPKEIAELKSLQTLDLNDNQLSDLPKEIAELKSLQTLDLNNNQLSDLPKEIAELKSLQTLDLRDNQLSDLPKEITELKSLQTLYLSENQLSDLPKEIAELKSLQTLYLSDNQLSDLPKEITELKSLQYLYLSKNQLSDLPKEIAELKSLQILDLKNNQLSDLPKEIAELNMGIYWKDGYTKGINLYNNPLKHPPIEIIKQGREKVLNYYKSIEKESIKLFEAKLLIVGQGGVGKTCLMNRIIHNQVNEDEISTEGIDIQEWSIKTEVSNNFRINFWDFGGQEIYKATHQFFLTKRSLYILLWEARKDNDLTHFDYWLSIIRLLSDSSPVLIVLNKIDERIKTIDEQYLQQSFKNIVGFHKVSAKQNLNMDGLVKDIISNITQLDHIGDTLPKAWVDIRKQLEDLDENFISHDRYLSICRKFELTNKEADFLSLYFHDLGVFLHFQDNAILSDILFLKPEWATNAVYKVLDTKEVQSNYGVFNYDELKNIWHKYPSDQYIRLIELMKKFEICFQIPDTKTYIVPRLLRTAQPHFDWNNQHNLRFEYHYPFMPDGIISRFIVRTHNHIKDKLYWQNGLVLNRDDSKALMISDVFGRKISIQIVGPDKKELLYYIRGEIDYIHSTLNNPEVSEMIACSCSECIDNSNPFFYKYKLLKKYQSKGKKDITCEKSLDDVSVDSLLGGIELKDNASNEHTTVYNTTIKGNYYGKGSNDMNIQNLNAENGSQVNIADHIDKISYHDNSDITKEDWQKLSQWIKSLDPNVRMELRQYYETMKQMPSDKEKNSLISKFNNFILKHGIPISQSLTAAGIFEVGKLLL